MGVNFCQFGMSKLCKLGHVTSWSQTFYYVKWEHFSYFIKLWCSFHDFKATWYIFSPLGKVKIVKKKLLERQSLLWGDWVLGRRNRLFPKSMKYLTIAKQNSFAVVIRTCLVPVQLKPLCKLLPFLLNDFPRVFGRI